MDCEIVNVSDQIVGYAEEAASAIVDIKKRYGLTEESACEAVKAGLIAMQNDVIWKRMKLLSEKLAILADELCM